MTKLDNELATAIRDHKPFAKANVSIHWWDDMFNVFYYDTCIFTGTRGHQDARANCGEWPTRSTVNHINGCFKGIGSNKVAHIKHGEMIIL